MRKEYSCENCGKKYVNYKSFWAHNKKCKDKIIEEKSNENNEIICKDNILDEENPKLGGDYLNVINKLLIENKELKNFVIEQSNEQRIMLNKMIEISKPTNQTINNTMNNNKAGAVTEIPMKNLAFVGDDQNQEKINQNAVSKSKNSVCISL